MRGKGARVFLDLVDHLLIDFERVNFQVQLLVFNKTVDSLGQHRLEVALTGSTACIRGHHTGDRCVRAEQRTKLGSGLELGR